MIYFTKINIYTENPSHLNLKKIKILQKQQMHPIIALLISPNGAKKAQKHFSKNTINNLKIYIKYPISFRYLYNIFFFNTNVLKKKIKIIF